MRNPNGYGSVHKLSGNRRRPWTARITVGYDSSTGYQVYKYIGYYSTRSEAMRALALYNGDVTEDKKITFGEVYLEWKEEHEPTVKGFKQYSSAMKAFEPLFNKPMEKLAIRDFEDVGEKSGKSIIVLNKAKQAIKGIYSYGYRKGYIDESKAVMPKFIKFTSAPAAISNQKHKAFTSDEIKTLWNHSEDKAVEVILFMIYSGVRISELANVKKADVRLKERYFEITESKTESGRRKVPIADKIYTIASSWMKSEGSLFSPICSEFYSVDYFRRNTFEPRCRDILGVVHLPHDTRYTTATLLTEAEVDQRYIKMILGHAFHDVTNAVYAKKISNEVLLEAINRI